MSSFCQKNQRVSTLFNANQLVVLIRLINDILHELDGSQIYKAFESEREIIEPLVPFMRTGSFEVKLYIAEAIKTLGTRAVNWLHQLISIFLSHTSIANADLVSIAQVPIYSPEAYMPGLSQRKPQA